MSKSQMSGPYLKFINKIRQLKSAYYKGQKQKQMHSEQQLLSNDELFKMSVELLKENLDMDQIEFEQFSSNEKFKAYIRSIESIGLMLSKFYQEQESELKDEIQNLKVKNHDNAQKLTNYMQLNQTLNDQVDHLQHIQALCDQQLNNSEHEIQHRNHSILTQINARELLTEQNHKLQTQNHQLLNQISNLKQIIETLGKQNYEGIKQNKQLHIQISKFRTFNDKIVHQKQVLEADKKQLEAEIHSLNLLLEQKDYLLGNKPVQQSESYQNFAQIRQRFLSSTVRIVRQQNQDAGSDKQVMKGIQQACRVQPIFALKFSDSRSVSRNSQISSTSIRIQNLILDDILDSYQESPEHYGDRKLLKTDRKRKQSTGPKEPHNKSCNKAQDKIQENSASKILFINMSPKLTDKTLKGQHITDKKRKEHDPNPKLEINLQRNSSQQNHSKIKNRKLRSNTSVILRNTKSKVNEKQSNTKKGKIEHSQSVQDLYRDDVSQSVQIDVIQRELFNKQKIIQNLKLENRSVRQMVLEQSQKRTDAEHEYEQKIQKLQSEVQYFKKQMKENYIKYVQQKALSGSLQNQLHAVSEQVHKKGQEYQKAKNQLKDKCKQFIGESIIFYQSRYEQVQQKMRNMEFAYLNGKRDLNDIEDDLQKQDNPKPLKKCKSNSLFYKQVKHHSYNTSQEYSDINHLSANHSKNTSFINIDDEQGIQRKQKHNGNILIYDCDENQMEEDNQDLQDLCSYQDERQLCEMGVQTEVAWSEQDSSYKISLEYSKMQQVQDSSEISYDFSSLGLRSSEQLSSKIKLFLQERAEKIKRLNIYPIETISIESQKSFVSQFDTNPFSPRAKDISCLTADQSHLYKMKQNSPLGLEKAFAFTIDEFKTKCDFSTCTQVRSMTIVKNDSFSVRSSLVRKILSFNETVSEMILPSRKDLKNTEAQHQLCILENFQTQTSLSESESIGVQIKQKVEEISTQTQKQVLTLSGIFSYSWLAQKKQGYEMGTQMNSVMKDSFIQTLTKNLTLNPIISQVFMPQLKIHHETSTQTPEATIQLVPKILNQTILPTFQRLKNDHNQSFIQQHVNEVLFDMSQSFQMSEHFIQTLKKKPLLINENLKQLQEQKHNDSNDSSSSDSHGVEKIFNSIEMDINGSVHQRNLSVQTISTRFNADLFEGNVQTSKASTNCSVSTSLSFHSPSRNEAEEGKLKVPEFQEILEIQSENVDSFTRIEPGSSMIINTFNRSDYEGSVNRSPQQENILSEELKVEAFKEVKQCAQGSGQKHEQTTKKLQKLLGSQKSHIIDKSKVLAPLNSPKCKPSKHQIKAKTGQLQKPRQLQLVSETDFDLICRTFKAKRMKIVERKQQKQMKNESTDASENYMYHHLSSRQLMVVFCKQVSTMKNTHKQNIQCFVVHESRIISLTQNFQFQASRVVVSTSGNRMIFGNQEITLTETQLRFSLNNKLNHFYGLFPSQTTQSQMEMMKQGEYEVLSMFKYKFK